MYALVRSQGESMLAKVLTEAKASDDVAATLSAAGVNDFEQLIAVVSAGDHHEELRKLGITKLGARAKYATADRSCCWDLGGSAALALMVRDSLRCARRLATLVQPYWKALAIKEQGNAQYKDSRFEDAANLYTRAIKEMPMSSCDLALNCYSNRAACFQQMREPKLALADVNHVLVYDPTNAKALARKQVYEQQVASER